MTLFLLFPGLPEDPRLTIGSRARREVPPDRRTVETLNLSSEEEPNQGYSLPNPALPPFPDPVSATSQAGPSTSSAGGASGASKYPKIQPYYSLADIQVHCFSHHTILDFERLNTLFRHCTNSIAAISRKMKEFLSIFRLHNVSSIYFLLAHMKLPKASCRINSLSNLSTQMPEEKLQTSVLCHCYYFFGRIPCIGWLDKFFSSIN